MINETIGRGKPHLLLCSAWQNVNIGDIAHTPSALALLEQHLPDVDVTVWPWTPLSLDAARMISARFPHVRIVNGTIPPNGAASNAELANAIQNADFFLHGSGPAMLGWERAEAFARLTGRPFGVYGVTYGLYGIPEKQTLSRARFVYFRDSVSLRAAQNDGVHAPVMELAPDTAFAFNQRDDAKAEAFLRESGLDAGKFLCCISRLRYTPFWEIPSKNAPFDAVKHARNEEKKEADHQPLRDAIIAVVRQTEMKILICPEDETQMRITKENLFDRLPADVQKRVVWRDRFWLPDEALSVYNQSAGLFGSEMHSPIMCIGNGIPAIVCRWAEQSTKGLMWRDIGLGDWLFDMDNEDDTRRVADTVLRLAQNPKAAREKAHQAREFVRRRQQETLTVVRHEVQMASEAVSAMGARRKAGAGSKLP